MKQDKTNDGPSKAPSGLCHHSSLLLILFQSEPASQGWCLISSLTPTERTMLYRWGKLCAPITNAGSGSTSKSAATPWAEDNEYVSQCILCLSKTRQHSGARHTHRHHNLKPTMHCAANTQLSNLKAFLILMEKPPCHILSPEHPAGCRMMNLLTDSLPMCWLITWPWPNWIWAVQVARPGLKPRAFSTSSFDPVAQEVFLNELREAQYIHPSRPRSKTFSSK